MNQSSFSGFLDSVEKEIREILQTFHDVFLDVRDSLRGGGIRAAGKRLGSLPMMDPVRFKKILVQLLKLLIIIELLGAFTEGINQRQWGRFGFDLIVAGVLYVMWERITFLVLERKKMAKQKMETASQYIKPWDALIFSLLWSDEIYSDIPADHRRLVVIAYTLITLGLVAAFIRIGTGLMPLVVSGALVLGAVNLVVWVVSLEREEKESLKTELKLAHDVQTSMMPKTKPVVEGFDIAGWSMPAKEVGGDLFDYEYLGVDGDHAKFGISIFDVSGKGMQAAMSAVFTSGAFASEARQYSSAAGLLTRLNRAVYTHSRRGHFVAFLIAVLDVQQKSVTFANAGQTKPLLRSGGTVSWLDPIGVHFPLGMKEDSTYEDRTVQLRSGDVLFLLTDGFTDAMDNRKEMFGLERIEGFAERDGLEGLSAEQLLAGATEEVRRYVADAPQHDDMTMVVIKVL